MFVHLSIEIISWLLFKINDRNLWKRFLLPLSIQYIIYFVPWSVGQATKIIYICVFFFLKCCMILLISQSFLWHWPPNNCSKTYLVRLLIRDFFYFTPYRWCQPCLSLITYFVLFLKIQTNLWKQFWRPNLMYIGLLFFVTKI